jgi:hypothetical protein
MGHSFISRESAFRREPVGDCAAFVCPKCRFEPALFFHAVAGQPGYEEAESICPNSNELSGGGQGEAGWTAITSSQRSPVFGDYSDLRLYNPASQPESKLVWDNGLPAK